MIRIFSQYVSPKTLVLVGLETALITLSLVVAARLRFWDDTVGFYAYTDLPRFAWQTLTVVLVFRSSFYLNDLYDLQHGYRDELLRVMQSIGGASFLLGVLYFLAPSLLIGRGVFFLNVAVTGSCILLNRLAVERLWLAAPTQNTVVLGGGRLAGTVVSEIAKRPGSGRSDSRWTAKEVQVPANDFNYESDNERLDCGHYEYLSRAFATHDGFLICTECHAALLRFPERHLARSRDTFRLESVRRWIRLRLHSP
jgi:hypothetical protein